MPLKPKVGFNYSIRLVRMEMLPRATVNSAPLEIDREVEAEVVKMVWLWVGAVVVLVVF